MSNFRMAGIFIRLYAAGALIVAAVLSPTALSFLPVILLAWYLYQWWRPVSVMLDLLTQYFLFLALTALFSAFLAPFLAPLIALPLLVLILQGLEKAAPKISFRKTARKRRLTPVGLAFPAIALAVLLIGAVLNSLALVMAAAIVLLGLAVLGSLIFRHFPLKPVQEEQRQMRILAGQEEQVQVPLNRLTGYGGLLFMQSGQDWLKVKTGVLSLKDSHPLLQIALTPPLSGPSVIRLRGYAIDRWGLVQNSFEIEPLKLYVIPRARYAVWLAQKYLSGTQAGSLPLISNTVTIKTLQGLRQGTEYYGNRLYQPGDSLKNISWKHSVKFNKLITKEFTEFRGQPAIMLVNLEANNAEGADKLAYNIIATALTLGQENIPAALAAYNQAKVVLITPALAPRELMVQALQVVKSINLADNPAKYLNPPDVLRLKTNIRRLGQAESQPAKVLAELLKMEYLSLSKNAQLNLCTRALSEVTLKVHEKSSVVILSQRNHDAESLALNSFRLSQRGMAVINI